MSTLGDLLAEHTMLPGSAVDHLHAVVAEWQLLADLSFADYLMWVRRDDGGLVCVAQCRPNTAPDGPDPGCRRLRRRGRRSALVTSAFTSGGRSGAATAISSRANPRSTSKRSRCVTATRWWPC